jgi:GMP synthase-like glutamine amidotransferase
MGSPKMHLAVLMTNTDESDFAQAHPKDGEKFTQLIHMARPAWSVTSYAVKDGIFPKDIEKYAGILITGSPASVHDSASWIPQLLDLIRSANHLEIPMFGACFGHQAIALALGGEVASNPKGWVFGLTQTETVAKTEWTRGLTETFDEYGAHIEQVTELPNDAEIITKSDACPIAGFRIGNRVYTTQNHPEMTPDFMAALVGEYAPNLPPDIAATAKSSLTKQSDMMAYAQSIARFFEFASTD